MITYKIHLIRTGSTSDQPGERYVGQLDLPLCDDGIRALEELREDFDYPKAQVVYTSPLSRCIQTADILYPHTQTITLDGFKDMCLGEFQGKAFEELRERKEFAGWITDSFHNSPPGGEDVSAFTRRVVAALNHVFCQMMEQKLTSVAVITHGGVIMTLLAAIGLPKLPLGDWATANGTGYTLLMTPQMWMRDHAGEVFRAIPGERERGAGGEAFLSTL